MEMMGLIDLAVRASVLFFAGWCAALLLAECGRHLWNWVDDHANPVEHNPLMALVQRQFFPGGDSGDVWLFVVLVALWPLYLIAVVVFYSAKAARGLRRWHKQRQSAAVSA
jgi:hypothetical protein